VLGHHGNDHRRVFRTLALVDGHPVGRNQHVEFATAAGYQVAVKPCGKFASIGVDILHKANVAVVDLAIVAE
jgi:hypothetical protein